jgi:hypothetical protein
MVRTRWILVLGILLISHFDSCGQWTLRGGLFADLWISNSNEHIVEDAFNYRQQRIFGFYSLGLKPSYTNHYLDVEEYIVPAFSILLERPVWEGVKFKLLAGLRLSPHNRNHIYSAVLLTGVEYVDDLGQPSAPGYHPSFGELAYAFHSKYGLYSKVSLKSKNQVLQKLSFSIGMDYLSSWSHWLMFNALYNEWQGGFGEQELYPAAGLDSEYSSIKATYFTKSRKHGAGILFGAGYQFSWLKKRLNSEFMVNYNLGLMPLLEARHQIIVDGEVFEYYNVNKGTSLQIGLMTDIWRFGKHQSNK